MQDDFDSTPTDLALRCFAPPMIARAWVRAQARIGDHRDLLSHQIGIVQSVLCTFTAVLFAEWSAMFPGAPVPKAFAELLERMDRASWGSWCQAAQALAKEVALGEDPIAPEFAALFYDARGRIQDGTRGLIDLIERRNELAHSDGGTLGVAEHEARRILAEIEGPLARALGSVKKVRHPILVVTDRRLGDDKRWTVRIARYAGTGGPEMLEVRLDALPIPDHTPFLVSPDGDALLLYPLVAWDDFWPHGDGPHPRVVVRTERSEGHLRFVYGHAGLRHGAPVTDEDLEQQEAGWLPPTCLPNRAAELPRRIAAALPQEVARRLHDLREGLGSAASIAGYTLHKVLGRGASATVSLATWSKTGERVALKVLHPRTHGHVSEQRKMLREAEALRLLGGLHPGLPRVHEATETVLAMEYIEGADLHEIVQAGPLDAPTARTLCREVLEILAVVHARGLVHRDVKPANIVVRANRAHLVDFGIARFLGRETLHPGHGPGTYTFAPEVQLAGIGEADARWDLYAVGRTLEYLTTGAVGPRGRPGAVPDGLLAVVQKATQGEFLSHGFQSCADMIEGLDRALGASKPFLEGTHLGGNYELVELVATDAEDWWLYRARQRDRSTDLAVIVAARTDDAAAALRRVARQRWATRSGEDGGHGWIVTDWTQSLVAQLARLRSDLGTPDAIAAVERSKNEVQEVLSAWGVLAAISNDPLQALVVQLGLEVTGQKQRLVQDVAKVLAAGSRPDRIDGLVRRAERSAAEARQWFERGRASLPTPVLPAPPPPVVSQASPELAGKLHRRSETGLGVVGIDLGTEFSAIAHVNAGVPEILPNAEGDRITPSVILFEQDDVIVGNYAKQAAVAYPEQVVQFVKRHMGDDSYRFSYRGRDYSPEALSSYILAKLKHDAELRLGHRVERAVVTVPNAWTHAEHRSVVRAAELAGLKVLRLLSASAAVVLAYGLNNHFKRCRVLVVDLGSRNLDLTLADLRDDHVTVIGSSGDPRVGGIAWDEALIHHVAEAFLAKHGLDPRQDLASLHDLRQKCVSAKISLTKRPQVNVFHDLQSKVLRLKITRTTYDELTERLVRMCEEDVRGLLGSLACGLDEVDVVLLAGGASRVPVFRDMLQRTFGRPPDTDINPDEAQALGAAIAAAIEAAHLGGHEGPDIRFHNVISHPIGMAVLRDGRLVHSTILPRNTPIPATRTREYTTTYDQQTTLEVCLVQGEDDVDVQEGSVLGRFEFRGIPPRAAGETRIAVTCSYASNGIIEVKATDQSTGRALGWASIVPARVVLVMDCSGSMYGPKIGAAKRAALAFLRVSLRDGHQVGMVAFPGGVVSEPTSNLERLHRALDELTPVGSTPMVGALRVANALLPDVGESRRVVVILTDGIPDDPRETSRVAEELKGRGVRIVAIAVGDDVDPDFLRSLASGPADFRHCSDELRLEDAFLAVAAELAPPTP